MRVRHGNNPVLILWTTFWLLPHSFTSLRNWSIFFFWPELHSFLWVLCFQCRESLFMAMEFFSILAFFASVSFPLPHSTLLWDEEAFQVKRQATSIVGRSNAEERERVEWMEKRSPCQLFSSYLSPEDFQSILTHCIHNHPPTCSASTRYHGPIPGSSPQKNETFVVFGLLPEQ